MTHMAWVVPMLTATVKLSRLARQDSPVLGILDGWACLYPHKRLALKTIELIAHDRIATGGRYDRKGSGVQAP